MCFRFLEIAVGATLLWAAAGPAWAGEPLRVCADPDNPPLSQRDGGGFENRIAQMLADDLQRPLQYAWLRDRRGFIRKTMGADLCDLFIGVPVGLPKVRTSTPYYRSSFFFVTRSGDSAPLTSFDDPRLPSLRIGVQLIGIDPGTTPAGLALARRGAAQRVVGYTLAGDDRPPAQRMVQAVAEGGLDSAVVWGPQAGRFVRQSTVPLRLNRAEAPPELAPLPFEFSIAMGVRPDDEALLATVEDFLHRRRADVDAVLAAHAVPRTDTAEEARP